MKKLKNNLIRLRKKAGNKMELPPITKTEQKLVNRFLKVKSISRKGDIGLLNAWGLTWYFEKFYEKLILILAMLSLFYSIIRIINQGFW